MNVAAAGRVVDCLSVRITSSFTIYQDAGFICVTEVPEGPLHEIIDVADVLGAVEDYQMAALVLVEETFQLCLRFLQVLVPLCWEEFQNSILHSTRELFFELLDACDAFVKVLVANDARQRDMITSCELLHFFQI